MTLKVKSSPEGRAVLQFADVPEYCHALDAAPVTREPMLEQGRWLILAFARWSKHDINAVSAALEAVRHFGGAVQLGARPYDDPEEHRTWLPEIADETGSPAWALLENGVVRHRCSGPRSREALIDAISTHLGVSA